MAAMNARDCDQWFVQWPSFSMTAHGTFQPVSDPPNYGRYQG